MVDPLASLPLSTKPAIARIARRLSNPGERLAWTPPPPAVLIERIDAALASQRRAAG